jgi:hypothetical protein
VKRPAPASFESHMYGDGLGVTGDCKSRRDYPVIILHYLVVLQKIDAALLASAAILPSRSIGLVFDALQKEVWSVLVVAALVSTENFSRKGSLNLLRNACSFLT